MLLNTLVSALLLMALGSGSNVLLVEDGRARAILALPEAAHPDEELAVRELRRHIEEMSGARLETVRGQYPSGMVPVRVGSMLNPGLAAGLRNRSTAPDAFLVSVTPDAVSLVGNTPQGTLIAAYELLEQLGCRWYLPGDLGAVVPKTRTVSLQVGETYQAPSFPSRHLQNVDDNLPWARRARLGGPVFPSCHGISLLPQAEFDNEPGLFALVNGKRQDSQLCLSNPEVLERAIAAAIGKFDEDPDRPWIGMGPRDSGGYCECEGCLALDSGEIDPITNRPSRTDRYVWFFNRVLEAVHEKHPGKKICFYAYDRLKFPPCKFQPSPYLVPAFAPITQCRIHGIGNPVCPDRAMYEKTIREWCAAVPETYERGYYFNLACPGFPFSKVHAIREETPLACEYGVKGWRVETKASWASNGPSLYVAARLMWDVTTDVDALLAEFYDKFFGPAADPMGQYFELVDSAFRDTDSHTGGSFGMPCFFPPERMARATRLLDRAAKKTARSEDPLYSERVRVFRMNHERLDAFLDMLEQRNRFDFATANESLDKLYALTDTMINYRLFPSDRPEKPVSEMSHSTWSRQAWLIYPGVAPSYINRFWAPCTRAGYQRTVTDGDLVAGTPDEWDFLIDPTDVGEALGWYRDGLIGGNWQKIRTKTASWSDQGLHYYKGVAWYRAIVTIGSEFEGRGVYLWFGGVDEHAKVWLNGRFAGESDDPGEGVPGMAGVFKPCDIPVTKLVRFDRPNTVAVKVTNVELNELGTGGIVAPVMFWSPKTRASLERLFSER